MKRFIIWVVVSAATGANGVTVGPYGGVRFLRDFGIPGGAEGFCAGAALDLKPGAWDVGADLSVAGPYSGEIWVTDMPNPTYTAWELAAASTGGRVFGNGVGVGWDVRWSRVFIDEKAAGHVHDSYAADHISSGPRFTWAYKVARGVLSGSVGGGLTLTRFGDAPHMNSELINAGFGMGYELTLSRGAAFLFAGDLLADIYGFDHNDGIAFGVRFTVGPVFDL